MPLHSFLYPRQYVSRTALTNAGALLDSSLVESPPLLSLYFTNNPDQPTIYFGETEIMKNLLIAAVAALSSNTMTVMAFTPAYRFGNPQSCPFPLTTTRQIPTQKPLFLAQEKFEKMAEDDDQVIAFMDVKGDKSIDCYVDSYATVDGVEYTIGSPCDYAVALCYFEGDDQLVPIELDDPLMDDIFPIAEGIIEDEFGEELVLLRTPQTLTLVGVSFV